jgi:hypothetical protein
VNAIDLQIHFLLSLLSRSGNISLSPDRNILYVGLCPRNILTFYGASELSLYSHSTYDLACSIDMILLVFLNKKGKTVFPHKTHENMER